MKLLVFALFVGAITAVETCEFNLTDVADTGATQPPPRATDPPAAAAPDVADTGATPPPPHATDPPAAAAPVQLDSTLDPFWQIFKTKFNKKYMDEEEEKMRRRYWEENLKEINLHNLKAALGMFTHTLAINHFGDIPHPEMMNITRPLKLPQDFNKTATPLPVLNEPLPNLVDWRRVGCVSDVKDQGTCGSCWAFSAAGALEGLAAVRNVYNRPPVSLSTQNLMDCSYDYGTRGCGGGWPHYAFQYVSDNNGIDSWDSYGYEKKTSYSCRYNELNKAGTCNWFHYVDEDEESLKQAVAMIGPISVVIDASDIHFYHGGVYNKGCCGKELIHAMLLIGYGHDDDEGDYWIIKNSWGADWGEKGYFRLARNRDQMCGISLYSVYPTG